MPGENVIVVSFAEDSSAYEGFTNLKELDEQGQLSVKGAAIVQRGEDGGIVTKDSVDNEQYTGTEGLADDWSQRCSRSRNASTPLTRATGRFVDALSRIIEMGLVRMSPRPRPTALRRRMLTAPTPLFSASIRLPHNSRRALL